VSRPVFPAGFVQQTRTRRRLLHVNHRKSLTGLLLGLTLLAGCSNETSTPATTPVPEVTTPTTDAGAQEALPLLTEQQGAQASALAPGGSGLAALASSDGLDTTITFWAWDGTQFQAAGSVEAGEPLLTRREGGAIEWRDLTGGSSSDAVVYLEGGTSSAGVHAVIVRQDAPGQWRLVPLSGQNGEGIDPAQDVYANDPLFDDSTTFVTRLQASGQAIVTYWRYGSDAFEVAPDPTSTAE